MQFGKAEMLIGRKGTLIDSSFLTKINEKLLDIQNIFKLNQTNQNIFKCAL